MALITNGIFTRSPYIITIDEPLMTGAKIELYIWRADQTAPTNPTYVRSKLIASSNNTKLHFNISNFVNEFFFSAPQNQGVSFVDPNYDYNIIYQTAPTFEWVFVRVKLSYTTNTNPAYTLKSDNTYRAFYGYGLFEEGFNPVLGQVHMTSGTYYYRYPTGSAYEGNPLLQYEKINRHGSFRLIGALNWVVRYTNLRTGAVVSYTLNAAILGSNPVKQMFLTQYSNYADGNKVEVFDASNNLQAEFIMKPMSECKYDPVVVDFINKYGAWQRTWFYKVSRNKATITSQEYNLMARQVENYDTRIGQRQQFNMNGKETILCNTGFVEENYADVIQELLLAEVIQVNGYPAKTLTRAVEYQKHINTKLFSYQVEFEYAYDTINSII